MVFLTFLLCAKFQDFAIKHEKESNYDAPCVNLCVTHSTGYFIRWSKTILERSFCFGFSAATGGYVLPIAYGFACNGASRFIYAGYDDITIGNGVRANAGLVADI
ncbi:hypothetical protein SDC9_135433 [bioreactor metagenome]|uniref:Uncharacterized protein n=1 Tax=bioreactor metagenome TaxID=1076179 RepID=A0A645DGF0_9ZZZZ